MTILLYPDIPPVKAPQLTLIMAIAVAEGIREVTGLETKIKWPNDIVVNGKKICGILTEMSTEIDYIVQNSIDNGSCSTACATRCASTKQTIKDTSYCRTS